MDFKIDQTRMDTSTNSNTIPSNVSRSVRKGWSWNLGAALSLLLVAQMASAGTATLAIDTQKPGSEISHDAIGLSYETSLMLPNTNGVRYFRPNNKPLVQMFQTLGIKSLRIGGNSVDAEMILIPGEKDIRSFFEF